jgi:hypothetical protein
MWGAGVIWNGDPLEPPVIPAKAGIQSHDSTFPMVCGADSRSHGNDRTEGRVPTKSLGPMPKAAFSVFSVPFKL